MVAPGVDGELCVSRYPLTCTAAELTGKPTKDERVGNWVDQRVSLGSERLFGGLPEIT
jgi:hypothetical protein